MALLRSGVVLFASFTIAAIAAGWGFLSLAGYGGLGLGSSESVVPILFVSAVTLTTSVALVVLAWRGRRQPLGDGVVIINLLVIGFGFVVLVGHALSGPSPYPDSAPGFYLMLIVGASLAIFIPAYLITYLALRRTPLLRGLAPPRKSKGPAEASPL